MTDISPVIASARAGVIEQPLESLAVPSKLRVDFHGKETELTSL